jgi:hypothetical protein
MNWRDLALVAAAIAIGIIMDWKGWRRTSHFLIVCVLYAAALAIWVYQLFGVPEFYPGSELHRWLSGWLTIDMDSMMGRDR